MADNKAFGEWQTEEGLQDDFDMTITRSIFTTDARYNNGDTLLLHWEGTTETGDDATVLWACGTGWGTDDGGKTAVHAKGGSKKGFNKQSWYGRLIDRCLELAMGPELQQRGKPQIAGVWEGLTLHLKREEVDFGTGIEAKTHLMPTAWRVAGTGTTTTSAPVASTPAASPAATATPATTPSTLAPKWLTLAKVQMAQHPTYMSWLEACLELPGAAQDPAFVTALADPGGLWTQLGGTPG